MSFKSNLVVIAIDEGYTIWDWRSFRKIFKNIGILCEAFPKVPVMVLSATLPPHVMSYIHTVARLQKPADLIVVPGCAAQR
jgi:superfamily II DNA helicase RecQ